MFRAIEVARAMHIAQPGSADRGARKRERLRASASSCSRVRAVFKFLLGTTKTFVELVKLPELSFRLLLQCAQSASECRFEAVAYQYVLGG